MTHAMQAVQCRCWGALLSLLLPVVVADDFSGPISLEIPICRLTVPGSQTGLVPNCWLVRMLAGVHSTSRPIGDAKRFCMLVDGYLAVLPVAAPAPGQPAALRGIPVTPAGYTTTAELCLATGTAPPPPRPLSTRLFIS